MAEYDLFLATPMSSIVEDLDYTVHRSAVLRVIGTLTKECGVETIYYAGKTITSSKRFSSGSIAFVEDLRALSQSKLFCLVYPERVVSSALIETGFALGQKKPCIVFARRKSDLPYLLIEAEDVAESIDIQRIIVREYEDIEHLIRTLVALAPEIKRLLTT